MTIWLFTECSEVMCAMYCKDGFQKDENGCEICKCNEPAKRAAQKCPLAQCFMLCQHGRKKDANGCVKCECNEPPKRGNVQFLLKKYKLLRSVIILYD